jgi:hypothetical protein
MRIAPPGAAAMAPVVMRIAPVAACRNVTAYAELENAARRCLCRQQEQKTQNRRQT